MQFPRPPDPVDWTRVYQLQAEHFVRNDTRTELLAYLAAAVGEPWPWGFFDTAVDETALASGELRVRCAGVFPSGTFFSAASLVQRLPSPGDVAGGSLSFHIESESRDSGPALRPGDAAPSERTLPIARIVSHRGVWSLNSQWSPPALLVGPDHPLRADASEALTGLAGLAAGVHDDAAHARCGGTRGCAASRGGLRAARAGSGRDGGLPRVAVRHAREARDRGTAPRARSQGGGRSLRARLRSVGPRRPARLAAGNSRRRPGDRLAARAAVSGKRVPRRR